MDQVADRNKVISCRPEGGAGFCQGRNDWVAVRREGISCQLGGGGVGQGVHQRGLNELLSEVNIQAVCFSWEKNQLSVWGQGSVVCQRKKASCLSGEKGQLSVMGKRSQLSIRGEGSVVCQGRRASCLSGEKSQLSVSGEGPVVY